MRQPTTVPKKKRLAGNEEKSQRSMFSITIFNREVHTSLVTIVFLIMSMTTLVMKLRRSMR